jgi:energy-coupling factor transport system substrate-specific component
MFIVEAAMEQHEKTSSGRLAVQDYISIGIYTAIYFVLVAIANFATGILIPGFTYILLPGVCALISGTVYMLMVAKVPKFGGITIMGVVMGVFFFASGHFVLSFGANIVCGVLADLIAKIGGYRNKSSIFISYIVFSYGLTGPVLPMWFMKDAYVANLQDRGKDAATIDAMFSSINIGTFWICLASILVLAVLGGLFGMKMLRKHFKKAGVV